jgi:tetratricopeptide (TPR) repeat protein
MSEVDRAVADYTEAIRLDPNDGQAYWGRALAYDERGDRDSAIADNTVAIRLAPKDVSPVINRGDVYITKGDIQHALEDFNKALDMCKQDLCSDQGWTEAYAGRCLGRAIAASDLDGALADCDEALGHKPTNGDAFNHRALIKFKRGSFPQALADYDAALAQNAKDADSLYGRGLAKLRNGDAAGGNADIAAAKTIDGGIAETFARYGVK